MNELKKLSGAAGIVIILLSLLVGMVKPEYSKYCWIGYSLGFVLLLLFAITNYKELKEQVTGRSAKYGSYMLFHITLVLFIVGFVNAITLKHSKQWDLTENKRFTLADQTVKVLKNLNDNVNAYCFFSDAAPGKMQVKNLVEQFSHQTGKFIYQFIDPTKKPALAQKHMITKDGTIALIYGDKTERIEPTSFRDTIDEEDITNALIKITRSVSKTVYFVSGHGERSIMDEGEQGFAYVKKKIELLNYVVKEIVLAKEKDVPQDCSILVIPGPKTDLLDPELETIKRYIERPGNVLIMVDPGDFPKLQGFLGKYGLVLNNNTVIDRLSQIMAGDATVPIINNYSDHPIVKDMKNFMSLFPLARGVEVSGDVPENIKIEKLCDTSIQSWAEIDLEMLGQGQAKFDAGKDVQGPVTLAVAIEIEHGQPVDTESQEEDSGKPGTSNVIVFGDSDFADNRWFFQQKNGDLFMNTISFLAEEKDLIAISPRSANSEPLILTKTQYDLVWYFCIIFFPLIPIFIGVTIYKARRSKG